jgi:hypothetical protein
MPQVLAKTQAETVHVHKQPSTHVEHLFGLFFAQSRARIWAALSGSGHGTACNGLLVDGG